MAIENLREKTSPYPFFSRNLAGEAVPRLYEETLSLGQEGRRKLQEINELLQNSFIDELTEKGKLTLGIIKPHAQSGRDLPPDDDEATTILLDEIGRENIVFNFSTQLTPSQIETFYADVKEKYLNVYERPEKTIWEEVYELLNSGPITFILLYKKDGDAISWWRNKMGKTHPAEADPDSIRGKYGIEENLPNNLIHGSDSIEGAKKEISVLKDIVSELTQRSIEVSSKFPAEENLKRLGIVKEDHIIVAIDRIYDSGMRAESWIYGYQLLYLDGEGQLQTKYIKEKHIISMGGNLELKAQKHYKALETLKEIGIEIPETYGVVGATLYQEFIVNDQTQEVLEVLRAPELSDHELKLLNQLIDIAARLDSVGALTLNFVEDLLFDVDRNQFLYIDAGYDLGEINKFVSGEIKEDQVPVTNAFKTLTQKLRKHKDYIEQKYFEIRLSL